MALEFSIVSTEDSLSALGPDWRDLCQRVPDCLVYQTFNWAWLGWRYVASVRGRSLLVLVGRDEDRVVLIWPLVTYSRFGLCLAHALDSETTEYREIVTEDVPERADRISQAWEFITRKCSIDALYLQYVPQGGLLDTIAKQSRALFVGREQRLYLDCRAFPGWSEYYKTLPSSRRSDLRRRQRRLGETGTIEIVKISDAEQLSTFLPWFFETKAAGLQSTAGQTDWFTTAEHRKFLSAALEDGLETGTVIATALLIDGNYIGGKIGIIFRNARILLVTTYDRKWSRFAPGMILYQEAVCDAFENRYDMVDFRLGDEAHKNDWTNRTSEFHDYWVPCTVKGKLYAAWRMSGVRGFLRQIRQRISG